MSKKSILIKKQAPLEPTHKEWEDSQADANAIITQSPVLQGLLIAMSTTRRLYMAFRASVDQEFQHGWECDNPALVIQILEMAAQEKALVQHTGLDVQRAVFETIIPVLDAIVLQERKNNRILAAKEKETPVAPQEGSEDNEGKPPEPPVDIAIT